VSSAIFRHEEKLSESEDSATLATTAEIISLETEYTGLERR
jgi:hypothetical protein